LEFNGGGNWTESKNGFHDSAVWTRQKSAMGCWAALIRCSTYCKHFHAYRYDYTYSAWTSSLLLRHPIVPSIEFGPFESESLHRHRLLRQTISVRKTSPILQDSSPLGIMGIRANLLGAKALQTLEVRHGQNFRCYGSLLRRSMHNSKTGVRMNYGVPERGGNAGLASVVGDAICNLLVDLKIVDVAYRIKCY
jgi:hypothetical protein